MVENKPSENYWMRQADEEESAHHPAKPKRARADILEDALYAAMLVMLWLAATLVIFWKTSPGGVGMVPTFLILEGMYTTLVVLAWVKTR